ncbi:hypothetical protein PUNSTDRAFT_30451, partial [Punctularia strigosozonata HHB-11173 SS5]|uniref:uncharacterized protein n=1 Tax=Punctularia strigosozonata (strain HHB-11173) TaxID=741275 RepID=UPI00044181DE
PQGDVGNSYYPDSGHDLTGGLPINLDSLRDGPPGSKPFYPYSTLIRYAIKGSPTGKLLLEDIYYAIESRFPYFRTAPAGWKNSVRHNLSLNPCFVKVPRPLTDRGKGSYWTVDDNVDPRTGVHRVRRKKTSGKKKRGDVDPAEEHEQDRDFPEGPGEYAQHPQPEFDGGAHPPSFDPSSLDQNEANRSQPFQMPYNTFDPSSFMVPQGMRFPPQMPIALPDESLEVDEHGNVNWQLAWRKELTTLMRVTEQQEGSGAEQDWYRMMLMRVRGALMAP